VLIHPDDAAPLNIREGEVVRLASPYGSCVMQAVISRRFKPGIVHGDYGWWFPEEAASEPSLFGVRKSNVNALIPSGLQGPGGFGYPFRSFICKLEKLES
jgi:anaerobic selenocysteine-containing dehydrogenase